MKIPKGISQEDFVVQFAQLSLDWRRGKTFFCSSLLGLLPQVTSSDQFKALYRLCRDLHVSRRVLNSVIFAWDVAMEFRVFCTIEFHRPISATLAWVVSRAKEYAAAYWQCRPVSQTARRIKQLLSAANCSIHA